MLLTLSDFTAYLTHCREDVSARLFVLGHAAPDGDAVLSALFEGWRLTLSGTPALPVVQAEALPREVAWLLGDAAQLVLTEKAVSGRLSHPDSRFVLTDHHRDILRQDRVVGIVDHHIPGSDAQLTGIAACIRPVGATVTLVAQKMQQDGHTPDAGVARLLLGGILLDTDGLSPHKAKPEDIAQATLLAALCGEEPTDFFDRLQAQLLAETDVTTLYQRDYRTYYGKDGKPLLGFAILKVWDTAQPDLAAVRRLLAADVAQSGCPVCVAKIMRYTPTGRGEQTCLAAGELADTMLTALLAAEGSPACRTARDEVKIPPTCPQRGRKWYAAHLQPLLENARAKQAN